MPALLIFVRRLAALHLRALQFLDPSLVQLDSHACCCAAVPVLLRRQAVTHYNNGKVLADVSCNLGEPMVGIDVREKGFSSYANRSE